MYSSDRFKTKTNKNKADNMSKMMKKIQKILVVDDEVSDLETMKNILEGNNYEVFTATNGEEALKAIKEDGKKTAKSRKAKPATFEPLLMGITQAALNTESFISAASFQ